MDILCGGAGALEAVNGERKAIRRRVAPLAASGQTHAGVRGNRHRPMIKNHTDHAANERTYLAWVRTAIAVMAFGFLVEKFDLFLKFADLSTRAHAMPLPHQAIGGATGLALIVMGPVMMIIATLRFLQTARNIDSPDQHLTVGSRFDIALSVLLTLLGASLLIYLGRRLFTGN
jgi:putative membrane protein